MTPQSNPQEVKRTPFLKTDFVKIGGTAMLTAAAFMAYHLFFANSSSDFKLAGSGIITVSEADNMRNYWHNHALIHVRDTITGKRNVLEAFKFNAIQLDSIINKNAALDPGLKADEVIFYIGRKHDTTSNGYNYRRIHLIAIGVKDDSLLIEDKRKPTAGMPAFIPSVYDKADPCPPNDNCPKRR